MVRRGRCVLHADARQVTQEAASAPGLLLRRLRRRFRPCEKAQDNAGGCYLVRFGERGGGVEGAPISSECKATGGE